MAFHAGMQVDYFSTSMGQWIPAKVLRAGLAPGTFDLDCKDGVGIDRIRQAGGGGGGSSSGQKGYGKGKGDRGPLGLCTGDACFYRSSTHGWITAQAIRFNPEDGSYDLDVKQSVPVASIFVLSEGARVEYHSSSSDAWIPARIVRLATEPDAFDLDCKDGVHISRVRPPSDLASMGGSMPPPSGGYSSVGGFGGVRGSLGAISEVSFVSEAPRCSASMPSPMWRYDAADGRHIDVRQRPEIDGPRVRKRLEAGDVFCVSEERRGNDGILYLQLADGRGWLFESKPGVGTMCQRYTYTDVDGPGSYVIIHDDAAVTPAEAIGAGEQVVTKLPARSVVRITEVVRNAGAQRIRGKLENPMGWVSLLDTSSGNRWAIKKQTHAPSRAM